MLAVFGSDAVSRNGDIETSGQASGGQVSNTQAWMERYTRRIKPDDRKWRTKSMRHGMGGLPTSTKFGDEVVSKVLLLARWRCKARKRADDRGFSMAARRPWLASLQQISERSGCVFGAAMEHDGIGPHVEMILQVSHAEQDRRLDLAAEQRDKELTPMDVIQQRVQNAMQGVKRWSTTGSRTAISKEDNDISVRGGRERNLRSCVVGDGGSAASPAAVAAPAATVRRASLILQGPSTPVPAAVDSTLPTPPQEMRPQPPHASLQGQRSAKDSDAVPAAPTGSTDVEIAPPLASVAEAVMSAAAPVAAPVAVQPPVACEDPSPGIKTTPSSPPRRQTTPVAEPPALSTGQDPGDDDAPSPLRASSPSSPSLPLQRSPTLPPLPSPPPPPLSPLPAAPIRKDKIWPDCNDLTIAGLEAYLAAAAAAAAEPPSSAGVPHGLEPAAADGVTGTDAQPSPSTADSQQHQQEPAAGLQSQPPAPEPGGGQQEPAATAKGFETESPSNPPGPYSGKRLAFQDPIRTLLSGTPAPPRTDDGGSSGAVASLHDTALSLGGLDMCRVAAAPIGITAAAAAAVTAAAASSMTLSRQVRGALLPHSLTMTKRGRRAPMPAPAPAPANTAGRHPATHTTATSAAADTKIKAGKVAAKLLGKTTGRDGLLMHAAPGEGMGRQSVEARSRSFTSQRSLSLAATEPDAASRALASLTMVDAALFWNSDASSPQTCSGATASSSSSPFSRASTLSRMHSMRPQPLPLPQLPLISSDPVLLPSKLVKTEGGGSRRGADRASDEGDGNNENGSGDDDDGGDALNSRASPMRPVGLSQLSPPAAASTTLLAARSPSGRSLTSWPGAAPGPPGAPPLLCPPALLPHLEAPPSPSLPRVPAAAAVMAQAVTGPQLAPLRLQPLQPAVVADGPSPGSPVMGSPTTTYSRSGINIYGPVGQSAAAATVTAGPVAPSPPAARLSGLASPARFVLSVPGSPSPALRETVLQHQASSISDINGGFGAVNSPVVAPPASRSTHLETEDLPLSALLAARRSMPTGRSSVSLSALPLTAAQTPEYGICRSTADPSAGLPDAASLSRLGSVPQQRGSASGAHPRVLLPELRTTLTAAQVASSAAADAVASPLRRGEEQRPSPTVTAAAAVSSAVGRLLPWIPSTPFSVAASALRGH